MEEKCKELMFWQAKIPKSLKNLKVMNKEYLELEDYFPIKNILYKFFIFNKLENIDNYSPS